MMAVAPVLVARSMGRPSSMARMREMFRCWSTAKVLPNQTRGVLLADVQGRAGVTPYAAWAGRWGLWPLVALGVLVFGGLACVPRRGRP